VKDPGGEPVHGALGARAGQRKLSVVPATLEIDHSRLITGWPVSSLSSTFRCLVEQRAIFAGALSTFFWKRLI